MAEKVQPLTDDAMLVRRAFAQFPSGVSVLAVDHEGERHALVASSFMVGVSLDPCLVAVAIQKGSATWELLRARGWSARFGVSIFGAGQGDLARQLAARDKAARFQQVAIEVDDSGAVYIEDAAMWLECTVADEVEAGDHWLGILEAHRMGVAEREPLVWHGSKFRDLVVDAPVEDVAWKMDERRIGS